MIDFVGWYKQPELDGVNQLAPLSDKRSHYY